MTKVKEEFYNFITNFSELEEIDWFADRIDEDTLVDEEVPENPTARYQLITWNRDRTHDNDGNDIDTLQIVFYTDTANKMEVITEKFDGVIDGFRGVMYNEYFEDVKIVFRQDELPDPESRRDEFCRLFRVEFMS